MSIYFNEDFEDIVDTIKSKVDDLQEKYDDLQRDYDEIKEEKENLENEVDTVLSEPQAYIHDNTITSMAIMTIVIISDLDFIFISVFL